MFKNTTKVDTSVTKKEFKIDANMINSQTFLRGRDMFTFNKEFRF